MMTTRMNTAETARMPTCSRTAGDWLSGVFSSLIKPATKNPGMWINAKNGATITLASRGLRLSQRPILRERRHPVFREGREAPGLRLEERRLSQGTFGGSKE